MYKKLAFITMAAFFMASIANAGATPSAQNATKAEDKPTIQSEDEKYAQVYDQCSKEAEGNESTYDKVFNTCMEKKGFPQDEYETEKPGDGQE